VASSLGNLHVSGKLCTPSSPTGISVQLLVPGATYSDVYWTFPVAGYSYADYMVQHGQTVLALDPLNRGTSSQVPSALVTVELQASVIHQVVQALRSGTVDGSAHAKVTVVGHSLGSLEAIQEASSYRDVDALVLTGFSHNVEAGLLAGIATARVIVPAQLTPPLSSRPLGDLTTPDGHRADWWHNPAATTSTVIQIDEQTKDIISAGELATFESPYALPETNAISVPVLISDGSKDKAFGCSLLGPCANASDLYTAEAPHFTSASSLSTYVLPESGHDNSLANNSELFYANTAQWIDQHVGQ
jgi:pimeloyl-ACP methyl ester carboxylesterase